MINNMLLGLSMSSFQQFFTKIVIGSAVPIALAFLSFLYDLKVGQDKLIIITEQKFLRQEDNNKDQQKQIDHLLTLYTELKVKVEAGVTRTELLETIKRIELYLEANKESSAKNILKSPLQKEILKLNNQEK